MSSSSLNWGVIGLGAIARAFARALDGKTNGQLIAAASRTKESADKFGDEFKVAANKRYVGYDAILADKDVHAVYIATPHPMHAEWAIKAARAGKHILCEKPVALNAAEAMAMIDAASENNVFFMEAFMYRCHPQTAKLVELIRNKAIGDVKMIVASFGFRAGYNATSRIWANELAGGGIMDVGCYAVSASRLIAGAALGRDFADPIDVRGVGQLAPTGVDEYTAGILTFPENILAQVSTGVGLTLENTVRIHGTEGVINVPNPWTADRSNGGKYVIHLYAKGKSEEIVIESKETAFAMEARVAAQAIMAGKKQAPSPAMTWDDSLSQARSLDMWRSAIGVVYNAEKRESISTVTVGGAKLSVKSPSKMKYGKIDGLDKKVSRLVIGADNQMFVPHGTIMFDDYFERGGNAFDTGFIYGGGHLEKNLGAWIKARGVRKDVVVLVKGAHTPDCNPAKLSEQLLISLERLQTDHADVYMMHRDNLDIPVSEFIDVLNQHHKAGRIKAFGGSNWSVARVQAANDYAKSKGLRGFTAVSNNFSLAHMVAPVWAGCIHASDRASVDYFTRTQMALMPWSSQARGFFLPHVHPGLKNEELNRCWFSEDNFKRRDRAVELAKKKGCEAINIALAYVLAQPFPTFPLVGPRTLSETRSTFRGLDIELTPQEVKWLNLEA